MSNDIVAGIAKIIREKILPDAPSTEIDASTPLLKTGLTLDSGTVFALLSEIENEFDVEFDDDDLTVELFRNVGSLAEATERKLET